MQYFSSRICDVILGKSFNSISFLGGDFFHRYTCRKENCTVRVHVKDDDSFAYKEIGDEHDHESQYEDFKTMYCDNLMKQKARTAPASMTPNAIYMEVVAEYVFSCLFSLFLNFARSRQFSEFHFEIFYFQLAKRSVM